MDLLYFSPKDVKDIVAQYDYDDDIMCEDDERVLAIKKAISQLPTSDRIFFCLYLEIGSSRKLGRLLGGISHSTVLKEVKRIKQVILGNLVGIE